MTTDQFFLGVLIVMGYIAMGGLTLGLLERDGSDGDETFIWAVVWPLTLAAVATFLVFIFPAICLYDLARGKR